MPAVQALRMCPLVSIEGIDSAGKSTLISLLPDQLRDLPMPVVMCGERMSPFGYLLVKPELGTLSPLVKAYLFAADRAWTYETHCAPALARGELVIWERYVDSALAYRSADAEANQTPWLKSLTVDINRPFPTPDLIVFLEVPPTLAASREPSSPGSRRLDITYLNLVGGQYEALIKSGRPYVRIDAGRSIVECVADVARVIHERFAAGQ